MPSKQLQRVAYLSSAVLLAITLSGCDDFYSDSPTFGTGPTVTVSADYPEDPLAAIEQAARLALSERLGIDPGHPRLIEMVGATWTESNPGCFPFDTSPATGQLVPGISALFEHEAQVFRYDANQVGTTGALCESVRRDVATSSAVGIFSGTPFLPTSPVILATEEQAAAFSALNPGAGFITESVDWSTESVAAIAVSLPDMTLEPFVRGGRLSDDGLKVIIELTAFESATPVPGVVPLWVFLEGIGDAQTIEVELTISMAPPPTPTPPPFIQG